MKIKSFVGLNSSGNSYSLAEDSLPNECDSVYFTLINQKYPYDEYYKGTFQNDKFTSALLSFSIEEVESWCIVSDPTALQRLIFSIDLDFYFDVADWERTVVDGKVYDTYPYSPARVDIEDLELTKETETLLKEYIEFAYYPKLSSLPEEDKVTLHNVSQLGLFIYEELRQELGDKYYLVYCPISSFLHLDTNFPILVDNNEGNFSWVDPKIKLPDLGKEIILQLDSFTGEFKKGWLESILCDYFLHHNSIEYIDLNRICRWQYTDE
jgi:hypothetical protein